MKKNKGFTLVELLAVVVILAILSLIAIPVISKQIQQSKINLYKEQVTRILEASEKYIQEFDQKLPAKMSKENFDISQAPVTFVTLKELIDNDFIKGTKNTDDNEKSIKNPIKSSDSMDNKVAIYFNSLKNQYEAVYCISEKYYKYYYSDEDYNNKVLKLCDRENDNPTPPGPIQDDIQPVISNVTAVTLTDRIYLSFKITDDSGISSYKIEYGTNTNYGQEIDGDLKKCDASGCTINNLVIKGLKANQTYYYKISATDVAENEATPVTNNITTKTIKEPTYIISPSNWSREKKIDITYSTENIENPKYYFYTNDVGTTDKTVKKCDNTRTNCTTQTTTLEKNTWYLIPDNMIQIKYATEGNKTINTLTLDESSNDKALNNITITKIDRTAPVINNITVDSVDSVSANIVYNAIDLQQDGTPGSGLTLNSSNQEKTTCKYGTSSTNLNKTVEGTKTGCKLEDLTRNTTYYYIIEAEDKAENKGNSGEVKSFKTSSYRNPEIEVTPTNPGCGYTRTARVKVTYYDDGFTNPEYYYTDSALSDYKVNATTYDRAYSINTTIIAKTCESGTTNCITTTKVIDIVDNENPTISNVTCNNGILSYQCNDEGSGIEGSNVKQQTLSIVNGQPTNTIMKCTDCLGNVNQQYYSEKCTQITSSCNKQTGMITITAQCDCMGQQTYEVYSDSCKELTECEKCEKTGCSTYSSSCCDVVCGRSSGGSGGESGGGSSSSSTGSSCVTGFNCCIPQSLGGGQWGETCGQCCD